MACVKASSRSWSEETIKRAAARGLHKPIFRSTLDFISWQHQAEGTFAEEPEDVLPNAYLAPKHLDLSAAFVTQAALGYDVSESVKCCGRGRVAWT